MIKVLNLYAGIGGNRKLWKEIEVTAIENNESVANAYKYFFPDDKVIVGDAHQYLLEHYQEFDFIWSSPPCPTHSRMRKTNVGIGERKCALTYPDMNLYQEIIILQHFFKGKWCVENVIPYYEPLIKPIKVLDRHCFWTNFNIVDKTINSIFDINKANNIADFDLTGLKFSHRKDQIIRNCVNPELGKHIFDCAFKEEQLTLKEGV